MRSAPAVAIELTLQDVVAPGSTLLVVNGGAPVDLPHSAAHSDSRATDDGRILALTELRRTARSNSTRICGQNARTRRARWVLAHPRPHGIRVLDDPMRATPSRRSSKSRARAARGTAVAERACMKIHRSLALLCTLVTAAGCQVSTGGLLANGKPAGPQGPPSTTTSSTNTSKDARGAAVETAGAKDPKTAGAKGERGKALRAGSVVAKLPNVKPEDSFDLDKVAAAFAALDGTAVMATRGSELAVWTPSPLGRGDQAVSNRTRGGTCGKKGLEAFGSSYLRESSGIGGITLEHDLCDLDYQHVPVGTPGVVWSTTEEQEGKTTNIVFVTLDGGRYEMQDHDWLEPVLSGDAPVAKWPTFPLHSFLGQREISRLVDARSKAATASLEAAKKAWDGCMSPVLDREEAEYRANNAAAQTSAQKDAKNAATAAKYEKVRDKTCGAKKAAINEVLLKYLTERATQRTTILEANRTRFAR
jgi:hypothetical protein